MYLPSESSQIPVDVPSQPCICILPLCAMTVGGWGCVWGKAGLTGTFLGAMDIWTSGLEGRPLEASAIDTTWDSS